MIKYLLFVILPLCLSAGERIASLSPAVTELVIYAGGKDFLCARSSVCTMPEVKHLPVAGDLGKPFPEAVLKSRATLVISDISHPQANWDLLRRCRIKVELLPAKSVTDLPRNIRKIGDLLQINSEDAARNVEKKIAQIMRKRPEKPVRAAIIFSVEPLISCGKSTFISDALSLAGVENIASESGESYFIFSQEALCAANPDVIIIIGVPEKNARDFFNCKSFQHLSAVKQNKLFFPDSDIWSKLSPRLLDNLTSIFAERSVIIEGR